MWRVQPFYKTHISSVRLPLWHISKLNSHGHILERLVYSAADGRRRRRPRISWDTETLLVKKISPSRSIPTIVYRPSNGFDSLERRRIVAKISAGTSLAGNMREFQQRSALTRLQLRRHLLRLATGPVFRPGIGG